MQDSARSHSPAEARHITVAGFIWSLGHNGELIVNGLVSLTGGEAKGGRQADREIWLRQIRQVGPPVAHEIEVRTPRDQTSTTIEVSEVRFDQNLEDGIFTQRALERGSR